MLVERVTTLIDGPQLGKVMGVDAIRFRFGRHGKDMTSRWPNFGAQIAKRATLRRS
jgi:hypothetical protein